MAITTTSTTVVGVFDTTEQAERAVRELTQSGISRDNISLVANDREGRWGSSLGQSSSSTGTTRTTGTMPDANESEVGRDTAIGAGIGALGGLLLGLGALAIPGIGPVVAAGPLMGMLGGAAVGAAGGGLVGLLREQGIPDEDANLYAESVRRGGTLVTVHASNGRADEICRVLDRNGAVDVEERGRSYRESGWNRFDDDSSQYSGGTLGIGGMGGGTQSSGQSSGASSQGSTGYTGGERRSGSTLSQGSGGATGSGVDWGASRSVTERGERRGTFSRVYSPSAMGSGYTGSGSNVDDDDFRRHWQSNYASSGSDYDSYRGAYEFGGRSARDSRYSGRSWEDIQDTLKTDYLRNNPNSTWDNAKGAVRYGWEKMTGKRD